MMISSEDLCDEMMGLFEIPEIPKHIRSELEEQFPQTDFAEAYRMLEEIDADLKEVTAEIVALLGEVAE